MDLNHRPSGCHPDALPAELTDPAGVIIASDSGFVNPASYYFVNPAMNRGSIFSEYWQRE